MEQHSLILKSFKFLILSMRLHLQIVKLMRHLQIKKLVLLIELTLLILELPLFLKTRLLASFELLLEWLLLRFRKANLELLQQRGLPC